MPKPPEFSAETIRTLMERSAMICNSPTCGTITNGPSTASSRMKLKNGQAAHIEAKSKDGPRFNPNSNDEARAHIDNGIWLCSNCHNGLIDKNKGHDYTVATLKKWKSDHETLIHSLLVSNRGPIAILRQFTTDGEKANNLVNELEKHGALYTDMAYEQEDHVIESLKVLRTKLPELKSGVIDKTLNGLFSCIIKESRSFMNETSKYPSQVLPLLPALRHKIGVVVMQLRDEFGCKIPKDLSEIIPK